ncbi:DUF4266 domain-containing protein [Pseudoduganella danionis]|uniref:DUF4266 domain-containing protein n=1 Tax=Pseudoduganella danionis TaxID=1890295 RepID=A0ABW9SSU9_9BURK|nr:DUF4266 domain-containing protein [Pseudoduganella danionis]MTW34700.1 DUF4266 domain-containing protein [Pseudoduganella danionis]
MKRLILRGSALAACLLLSACAGITPVQPWQKGILAKPEMTFAGDNLGNEFNEHIYSSREGASGGSGANGGGCGCY